VIRRFLPLLLALAILLASGVVHGVWTGRFGPSPDMTAAAARLDKVPSVVGQWTATELPMDKEQLEAAEAAGFVHRQYIRHPDSAGESPVAVKVLILCGRTGPIAVHPPTVCFTSQGMKQVTPEQRTRVADKNSPRPHELFETEFAKHTPEQSVNLQTFWTWTATGHWQAPSSTRFTFARHPFLYKLYVTRELLPAEVRELAGADSQQTDQQTDPSLEFLDEFLPALNRALFE
jgi:hypothetical protein